LLRRSSSTIGRGATKRLPKHFSLSWPTINQFLTEPGGGGFDRRAYSIEEIDPDCLNGSIEYWACLRVDEIFAQTLIEENADKERQDTSLGFAGNLFHSF